MNKSVPYVKRVSTGFLCNQFLLVRRKLRSAPIIPRHLQLAIRNDEFLTFLRGVAIAQGGVLPNISSSLLPKKCEVEAAKRD
ncbi:hypothetical protein M513_09831 [Trichuris suis]|uniref:Histone H2A C-terminal domain-containing protein n=1 Tax=Trichuris suis TaxID=68888 RepID=A0A085LWD3_9BILA|nr:hypothetical protein M513_09831 [Trichuris suis]